MDPSQLATLVIVAGIAIEKLFARLNCYDGVRSLHLGCSSCCDLDVHRGGSPMPTIPPASPMSMASPASEPAPSRPYSGNATPTVDELMRRVSLALAKPNASD